MCVVSSGPAFAQELAVASDTEARGTLPLIEESVAVVIDAQHATTRFTHVFENASPERTEGLYSLSVGDKAAATAFAYYNGSQRIVGEIFEKTTAVEVYEEVTGTGRDPGLLEKTGEGTFSFRVFPIEAGERKRVEVTTVRHLPRNGGFVEYHAPISSDRARVTIALSDDRPIGEIVSSSHTLAVEKKSAHEANIVATARRASGPLVLRYAVEDEPWAVHAVVHKDAGQDAYFVATLAAPPQEKPGRQAKDVTLVIDRSGSMSGTPLDSAKQAARDVVRRLGESDRVNVIAFDDAIEALYAAPRAVTAATRKEAIAYVERIQSAGGTDIAGALSRALAAQSRDARPDYVLFLTDGQSDAQAALAAARGDRGDVRVFTVGIGTGVDRPLLSRLAAEKRGAFTFIEHEAAIESAVSRLYSQIESPVLVDVRLDVEGARAEQVYPRTLPDLFGTEELRITGRLVGTGPVRLTLTGRQNGEVRAFSTALSVPESASRPWVGRQWAASRVDHLLEEIALQGATDELASEATELAIAYDLVTPYTAFLAIPESEETEAVRGALASARDRKRKILEAHPDAVALSRTQMPPGDPVLEVLAPRDALGVTAYFPFGLVEDLFYDESSEHWQTRFLVPNDVQDGGYDVRVVIQLADGTVQTRVVPYVIDSKAPEMRVRVSPANADGTVRLDVWVSEPAREVRVVSPGLSGGVVLGADGDDALHFTGTAKLAVGAHALRVVVADLARNEAEETLSVEVTP